MSGGIYVLGGGFIGDRLLELWRGDKQEVHSFPSSEGDLRFQEQVSAHLRHADADDVIVMTAARNRKREGEGIYEHNVAIARALAEAITERRRSIRQLVFLSSVDVYGASAEGLELNERVPVLPTDEYGQSKLASEAILQEVCWQRGVPLAVLRLPGVYGPNDRGKSVIGRLCRDAKEEGKITLSDGGTQERDYLFVDDLQQVIDQLRASPRHTVLNVATGQSHTLNQVAEMIQKEAPAEVAYIGETPKRPNSLRFDISLFRAIFPSVKMTELPSGIHQVLHPVLG